MEYTLEDEALDEVSAIMADHDPEFATAMIDALRNWLNDYFGDTTGDEIINELSS